MLDKNKPYATFNGCNAIGAKYQQGPKAFNSKGEELSWETGEVIEESLELKSKPKSKTAKK